NDILSVSSHMTGTIEKVSTEVAHLKESVDQTVTSMQEVTGGTGESSQAVQRQLVKTEEIQTHISDVEKVSQIITDNIHTTGNAVSVGQKHITELNRYTVQVDQASRKVAEVLEMFRQTTSKMNTITDLITNVASETSLLALNASIEAARAGDAGRGFAVVASEISGLASQTTEATDNIVSLIESVSSQVDTMVQTIQELIRTGNEESRCAEETSRSFTTISDNISVIQDHSQQLSTVVKNLASANREIVDSIQTISSITEEVNAHASETHDISERNQSIVSDLTGLMSSLNSDAAELKGHT
ncbi:MAG: chemotaxis protein, partial [Lachnospiraceae bacterium]|nr:chemotaxis protein [Lachnospiraceae bacterium]